MSRSLLVIAVDQGICEMSATSVTDDATLVDFRSPTLFAWLENATAEALDSLPFGVVAIARDGRVERYNLAESKLSGLTPSRVVGRNFFTSVAPCTNNFMVAHRFETESEIDDVINYVFTFRIAPLKVRLRLLKRSGAECAYLIVETRD
jgi:photoactive yellow protein